MELRGSRSCVLEGEAETQRWGPCRKMVQLESGGVWLQVQVWLQCQFSVGCLAFLGDSGQ